KEIEKLLRGALISTYGMDAPVAAEPFNEPEEEITVHAHSTFSEASDQTQEIPQILQPEFTAPDQFICTDCGAPIRAEDIDCANCHALIVRRYCSHCSKLIPDQCTICPFCQKTTDSFRYSEHPETKFAAIATCVVLLLLVFVLFSRGKTRDDVMSRTHAQVQGSVAAKPEMAQVPKETNPAPPANPQSDTVQTTEANQQQSEEAVPQTELQPPAVVQAQKQQKEIPSKPEVKKEAVQKQTDADADVAYATPIDHLSEKERIKRGRSLNNQGYTLM